MNDKKNRNLTIIITLILICLINSCNLFDEAVIDIIPGTYNIDREFYTSTFDNASVTAIIQDITVTENYDMLINVRWSVNIDPGYYDYLDKGSDEDNINMFLTDNLANGYFFTSCGGAALNATRFYDGDEADGWYLFPAISQDATSITFWDGDQDEYITLFSQIETGNDEVDIIGVWQWIRINPEGFDNEQRVFSFEFNSDGTFRFIDEISDTARYIFYGTWVIYTDRKTIHKNFEYGELTSDTDGVIESWTNDWNYVGGDMYYAIADTKDKIFLHQKYGVRPNTYELILLD